MRLVKINHERCGEYDARTFIAAPGDWTEAEIRAAVRSAQQDYLTQFEAAAKIADGPPNPGFRPNYEKQPNRLVRDVLAEHTAAKATYEAWEADLRKTRRAFENFLMDHGFESLWGDRSGAVEIECNWGHRHGQRLSYGADAIDTMPSPAKLAGVADLDDDDFG